MALLFIEKVKQNQAAFEKKVIEICSKMGFDPNWLMFTMNFESGLKADAKNPYSTATGLIQFMEATAKDLGTTTAALRAMSNVDQLDYVYRYFTKYGYHLKIKSFEDVYLSVFYPAAVGKTDDYSITSSQVVNVNKVFDLNKDGKITKLEIRTQLLKTLPSAYIPTFQKKKS